MSVSNIDLKIR